MYVINSKKKKLQTNNVIKPSKSSYKIQNHFKHLNILNNIYNFIYLLHIYK